MISLADIRAAAQRVKGVAVETPALKLKYFDARPDVYVKCENLQLAGAFKIRGAYNKIASLGKAARDRGVVAYSSGNHAQAVALASKLLGVRATVVMLDQSVPVKVAGTKGFGAEVIFGGKSSTAIKDLAEKLAAEKGYLLVPPFNDPLIMAGQGTAGLELIKQVKNVSAVLVQIGGGGLISGIATAIKGLRPKVRVIGVEPEGAAKMYRSREAGKLVTLDGTNTVADGLKPVCGGELTFEVISKRVDELVLVSDDEILETCRYLILREKILAEPSGAASLAAVRHGKAKLPAKGAVVAVVSGGNAELDQVLKH